MNDNIKVKLCEKILTLVLNTQNNCFKRVRKSCSPPTACITEPAPKNNNALKQACVNKCQYHHLKNKAPHMPNPIDYKLNTLSPSLYH